MGVVRLMADDELERPAATGDGIDGLLRSEADAALADFSPAPTETASAPSAPEPSKETAEMCAALFAITFNEVVAPRQGEHWKLTEGECKSLGTAYGALLDKYFPDLRTGPEFAAIIVTLAVFGPRVMTTAKKAADEQKQRAASAAAAPAPAGDELPAGVH